MTLSVVVVAEQLRRRVPGGIGTYVDALLRRLPNDDRVTSQVLASAVIGPDPLRSYGAPLHRFPVPAPLLTRLWDRGLLAAPAASVVHATSFATPPVRRGSSLTTMVHDVGWRHFPDAYPLRGRQWHEDGLRRAIETSELLFAPSAGTAADVVAAGADPAKVMVVPLGGDHLPKADLLGARSLLSAAGIDDGFLLAVGTLEPRKNLQRLFAGYARVRSQLPDRPPLVVVGPHGWGEHVRPVEGVVLMGKVPGEQLAGLYALCDLFVSVPLLEGFGLPALEAMQAGAPVVTSSMPSVGDASYIVDPHSAVAIGEAIAHVLTDATLRDQLRSKGVAHASRHTWAATVDAHVRAWRGLEWR